MELFVCALHLEAAPAIRELRLTKNLRYREFELFEGKDAALIVSGVGPVRSAMATTFLLQHAMQRAPDKKPFVVTNFGIAASTKGIAVSTISKINKIYDIASGDEFFPDLSLKSALQSLPLGSTYRPVTEEDLIALTAESEMLYDMEGSGFFVAASRFLTIEAIQVIKIVSDHCSPKALSKNVIQRLAEALCPPILFESRNLHHAHNSFSSSPLTNEDQQLLSQITHELRLTETEKRQLQCAAIRQKVVHGKGLKTMPLSQIPADRRGKKKIFRSILSEWEGKL